MPITWSPTLDSILREVVEEGGTWPQVASSVTNKVGFIVTADAARNRFSRLEEQDASRAVLTDTDTAEGLKSALSEARREIIELRAGRQELADAIRETLVTAISGMNIPPVLPPSGQAEPTGNYGVMLGADWQIGKLIKGNYDAEVAMRRVGDWFDQSIDIMKFHNVQEPHVLLLGDLVENENVFPKQPHLIDASLYRQIFLVAEAIVNGVRRLLASFPEVHVEGLGGNHGYNLKTSHPETNFDCIAMNTARLMLQNEDRLTFPEPITPGEEHWYIKHDVGEQTFFGIHGNQSKSKPYTNQFREKLKGYFTTMGAFDFAVTGHYHEALMADIGAFMHFAAGSTESNNTFAHQWLASGGQRGSQWTLITNDQGLVAPYKVVLE